MYAFLSFLRIVLLLSPLCFFAPPSQGVGKGPTEGLLPPDGDVQARAEETSKHKLRKSRAALKIRKNPTPRQIAQLTNKIENYIKLSMELPAACSQALSDMHLEHFQLDTLTQGLESGGDVEETDGGLTVNFKAKVEYAPLGFVLNLNGGMDQALAISTGEDNEGEVNDEALEGEDDQVEPVQPKKKTTNFQRNKRKTKRLVTPKASKPKPKPKPKPQLVEDDRPEVAENEIKDRFVSTFIVELAPLKKLVPPPSTQWMKKRWVTLIPGVISDWVWSQPHTVQNTLNIGFDGKPLTVSAFPMISGGGYLSQLDPIQLDNGDKYTVYVLQEIVPVQKGTELSSHRLQVFALPEALGSEPEIWTEHEQFSVLSEYGLLNSSEHTGERVASMVITPVAGAEKIEKAPLQPSPRKMRRSRRNKKQDEVALIMPVAPERLYASSIKFDETTTGKFDDPAFKVRPFKPGTDASSGDGAYMQLNAPVLEEMLVRYMDTPSEERGQLLESWKDGDVFTLPESSEFEHESPGYPFFWVTRSNGNFYLPQKGGHWKDVFLQ